MSPGKAYREEHRTQGDGSVVFAVFKDAHIIIKKLKDAALHGIVEKIITRG